MKHGKDCCKNEKVDVKISADQNFSQQINFEPLTFTHVNIIHHFDFDYNAFGKSHKAYRKNRPPPLSQPSLNILHSNFRI